MIESSINTLSGINHGVQNKLFLSQKLLQEAQALQANDDESVVIFNKKISIIDNDTLKLLKDKFKNDITDYKNVNIIRGSAEKYITQALNQILKDDPIKTDLNKRLKNNLSNEFKPAVIVDIDKKITKEATEKIEGGQTEETFDGEGSQADKRLKELMKKAEKLQKALDSLENSKSGKDSFDDPRREMLQQELMSVLEQINSILEKKLKKK